MLTIQSILDYSMRLKEAVEVMKVSLNPCLVQDLAEEILENYCKDDIKLDFAQDNRTEENFIYLHSVTVALLCASIMNLTDFPDDKRLNVIIAALIHDYGKIGLEWRYVLAENLSEAEEIHLLDIREDSYELINESFNEPDDIRRICLQALYLQRDAETRRKFSSSSPIPGAMILMVANKFDELSAVVESKNAHSNVLALRELSEHPGFYDSEIVFALSNSVPILPTGVSVKLNTGETGTVISENYYSALQPIVLSFKDNSLLDLSLPENDDIKVIDILQKMDSRYVFEA